MSEVYSLWLVPEKGSKAYRRLDKLICELAAAWDDAPEFEPHVTILGGISDDRDTVLETTETLIQGQQPLDLKLTGVQCSTTRYQCVFALIKPTLELLSLHQTAVHQFDIPAKMYVPHLSLVYGDMSIANRLTIANSVDVESLPTIACADRVAVVETAGSVQEWNTVATYRLSNC